MLEKVFTDKAYDLVTNWFAKVFLLVVGLIIFCEGLQYNSKLYVVLGAVMLIAGIFTKKGALKNDL